MECMGHLLSGVFLVDADHCTMFDNAKDMLSADADARGLIVSGLALVTSWLKTWSRPPTFPPRQHRDP